MPLDAPTLVTAFATVFLLAFMKGAFGGGFAIIGIPLLALAMDPLQAGALLAPVFVAIDAVALRFWTPSTWSKPDAAMLTPTLVVGIGVGALLLDVLPRDAVAIFMACLAFLVVGRWVAGGGVVTRRARSAPGALAAGFASGLTTMVAHAGGVPMAMYLLPLGLPKSIYAGTMSIVFTIGNVVKLGPWLWLVPPSGATWLLFGLCLPVLVLGVWAGWKLHGRLDERRLYRACYLLLAVTAARLLWDGVAGYLT